MHLVSLGSASDRLRTGRTWWTERWTERRAALRSWWAYALSDAPIGARPGQRRTPSQLLWWCTGACWLLCARFAVVSMMGGASLNGLIAVACLIGGIACGVVNVSRIDGSGVDDLEACTRAAARSIDEVRRALSGPHE